MQTSASHRPPLALRLQAVIGHLCWYSGLTALTRAWQRRRHTARLLAYHHILPASTRSRQVELPWTLYTAAAAFAWQMDYVARYYRPRALPDLVADLARGAIAPGSVAVTLDDGYQDQVDVAVPLLRARGIPATIAVIAGVMDGGADVLRDDVPGEADRRSAPHLRDRGTGTRFATAEQVRAARHAGVHLAAHSVTHRDLTTCDLATLHAELVGARAAVRALGDTGEIFCYPGGRHNGVVRAAVAAAGYRAALTCAPGANGARTDPLALRRVVVGASPNHVVAAQLAGLLDGPAWVYHGITRLRLWRAHRRAPADGAGGCRCLIPPPIIAPPLPRAAWPRVTIVVPTYNERDMIDRCLRSLVAQDYPRERLEILVIDGGSTDDTVARAQRYPGVTVLTNPARDAETAKEIGLRTARGELFMYLDADAALTGPGWLRALVHPLQEDPTLSASFTRFVAWPGASALERYLTYHPLQLGPLLRALCVDLATTILERRPGYTVCCFAAGRVPPVGLCLYRLTALRAVVARTRAFRWVDVAVPALLAQAGHAHVAYVPDAGIYHGRSVTLRACLRRQRRNVEQVYFPTVETREFRYVDFSAAASVWRVLGWVLRVQLVLPLVLTGLRESWRWRDAACLYAVPLAVLETDLVAWLFVRHPRGRALMRQGLCTLLRAALPTRECWAGRGRRRPTAPPDGGADARVAVTPSGDVSDAHPEGRG